MKTPERSTPQQSRVPPARDTKSVLYEAALEAVQDRAAQARTRAEHQPRRGRRFPLVGVLLLIGAAGATLLIVRPVWLAGPTTLPPESPGVAAASMRVVLVRERDLVFTFQHRTGHLPASLAEAGSSAVGLEYRQDVAGFSLTGHAGDSLITIRSTDSVATFLGDSFSRLRHRSTP
jgi:hypothetical protein